MCGIAAIVGTADPRRHADRVAAMLRVIAHRGPDGEGTWVDPAGRAAIGHRRLAIIDPETGQQPMSAIDGGAHIVFNGCVYNYLDLARELRGLGHRFRTASDTEVVLAAYRQWGAECVRRFNGMWAFAIWDEASGTLFCSRDRIGIKPFYYVEGDGEFACASEIKALLAGGCVRADVNPDGLRQYLTFQLCLDETTLFDRVKRLPPGHNLVVRPGEKPVITKFWDLSFDLDEQHDEAWFADKLSWLVEDATRLRLRSDVPLGAHLSGGLDSSTIVSTCRALLGDAPLETFTGAFAAGDAFDETRYARLVAEEARTEYHETYLGPNDFRDSIERIIWHMDEPAAGPGVFPQYWVSRLASRHVKVVLGGQGGDEIFIGYARYLVAYLEECLRGAIEDTAHRANYVATLGTIVPSLPTLEQYVPMLQSFWREGLFEEPARRYFRLMDRFADARQLLSGDLARTIDPERTFGEFRAIFEQPGPVAKINRILCFDVKTHLQSLLHVEDRTSMAWGLESRVPLIDHRLIELMASVPPTIKFRHGRLKSLFRRAIQHRVPKAILERRDKMGFPVPLNAWLANDLRDFVGDTLGSRRCRERGIFEGAALDEALGANRPFGRSLWGALCLELWHRRFIDADAPVIETTDAARRAGDDVDPVVGRVGASG